ncbi:MAG: HAD family hydrolase [Devosia sp.]|nr:HAD family hydrolase [Devosia sp.]
MVSAVLFDLDETLISRAGAIRAFVAEQYRRFEHQLEGIDGPTYAERFLVMEDNGRIPKDQLYPAFVEALGISSVDAPTLLEDYRANYPNHAVLNRGARETIAAIRADGRLTGIITNGNDRVQKGKLAATGLHDLFDVVVVSEAVGLRKPDPAIFALATSDLGVRLDDALFVGDNPEVDILGAAHAGMQTAWYRNGEIWPAELPRKADADIDHLHEVLHFPGR